MHDGFRVTRYGDQVFAETAGGVTWELFDDQEVLVLSRWQGEYRYGKAEVMGSLPRDPRTLDAFAADPVAVLTMFIL